MTRGAIHHLHTAYRTRQLPLTDVYNFFASRIIADQIAYNTGESLSSFGITPTNSFISVVRNHTLPALCDSSVIAGVPIGIKDNFCTDANHWNVPTTCASRALENFRPPYDAAVVASLVEAKALLMGKTNMDEFAMGCGATDGRVSGPVLNPWSCRQTREDKSPVIAGGSSGGSAAAVAAGLCVAALASDTGGSARLPAAYCGVVGFKPTYGLVSRHGLIPLVNALDVPSLVTSCVADAASILSVWLHPSNTLARKLDATCLPLPESRLQQLYWDLRDITCSTSDCQISTGRVRIGIPVEYHAPGLTSEMLTVWDRVAGWLADEFSCVVKSIRLPHNPMATTVYSVICAAEVASNMARYDGLKYGYRAKQGPDSSKASELQGDLNSTEALFAATRSQGFGDVVRGRILAGNFFLLRTQRNRYLDAARRLWRLIKEDFEKAFQDVDFLLTPVSLGPPTHLSDFTQLDNRTRTTLDDVCTVGANLAGVPALSLPICLSPSTGLPLSLQLIGPELSEPRLLRLAASIESRAAFPKLVNVVKLLESI
ncbi:hypothetical protein CRM22_006722 [Opisthorchis felineus]|uniref:Glutamyl-tRNA(Gln) amidotransferase subunit A, mitochondrial n=1 Tax=Opisthorchis felineus TaxID=147828 RepID=A0A4V3SEA5_OPIFE|nr:hypothetical protein CRM22_006722 [Opisthorchis felineus]